MAKQKKPSSAKNLEDNIKKSAFSLMEEEVLDFWDRAKIFEKSVANPPKTHLNPSKGEGFTEVKDYVFYDGPPFATGLPHYGHLVGSIMKDAVPRYWTMKGYRVARRWGWDCHGLPVENLAEKEQGLKNKQDIEKMGVENFNEYCGSIVMRYAKEWKEVINRLGRWVDTENDYKTMNLDYMESIWWVFKALWEKDLIYKGYKPMHICPRCGTTLSNFEVGQGYKDIKDLSATVKFELVDEPGTFLLAWTTTPWTLVGNVALAVNEDIEYLEVDVPKKFDFKQYDVDLDINSGKYIFSLDAAKKDNSKESKLHKLFWLAKSEYLNSREIKGKELIGKKYKPLFDYYFDDEDLANKERGWQICAGNDFVTTEEGTGVVHIAPAFGEDDMNLGQKYSLPFIQHVDMFGKFKPEVKDFAGMEVKAKEDHVAADVEIIKYLAHRSLLFAKAKYEHSYPHCWRCETPLLNYATESWFVKVTAIKDDLVENNKNINWIPDHVKEGRFGKWLEQARDWAISRNRYWGAPLPVWECDTCDEKKIIGSGKELEELSGQKISDLHKHFVDKIIFPCVCGGKMKRVEEVLDCWFESGSMPYAQAGYQGRSMKDFDPVAGKNFPAQFIAEGIDQTRGWFYTMLVISTALFGKTSFQNVIVNGIVLAEDGQKMSKSKENYPDPTFLFDKYGSDPLRLYLLSSSVMTAENINFSEEGVLEVFRKNIMILWNVYKFYEMFGTSPCPSPSQGEGTTDSENILDQWILTRLMQLTEEMTKAMDNYDLPRATRPITVFIDDLSTWYIRRSRDRFKGGIRRGATNAVHANKNMEVDKNNAIQTTGFVLLELSKLIAPFMPFMAENLWQKVTGNNFQDENKSVHLERWPSVSLNGEGPLLEEMEAVRKIVELGLAKRDEAGIRVRQPLNQLSIINCQLTIAEYEELIKDELNVKNILSKGGDGDLSVELDTKITPELKAEGIKREIVRLVNGMRKEAGLTIEDTVNICFEVSNDEIKFAIEKYKEEIIKDTLAKDLAEGIDEVSEVKNVKIEGEEVKLGIRKI